MSAGVTCCEPAIHCRLEMVGRGGTTASALYSLSSELGLGSPLSAQPDYVVVGAHLQLFAVAPDVEHADLRRSCPGDDEARSRNQDISQP